MLFLLIVTAALILAARGGAVGPSIPRAAAAALPPSTPTPWPTLAPVSAPTLAATPEPPYFSSEWLKSHPPAGVPAITAQGAIVLDRDTQQIMFAKNIHIRRPPASVMKIVTAMVALDQASPLRTVTVSQRAANMEPDKMGISAGEKLTVEQLLYGMLLDSGNDAAEALADGLGGHDAFVALMNAKARSLGLKDTHFVDPAGLDEANYTTPYDMAVLADAALSGYPTIRKVVSTKQITIQSSPTHKWFQPTNLNLLLWDYPGTYGMKVGYTDAAEYTIILACQRKGHNLMVVLLGSKAHFTEGRELLDWGFAHLPTAGNAPVQAFSTDLQKTG